MLKQRIIRSLAFTLAVVSLSGQAMSISTYRIYLDSDNSSASFLMFNKSAVQEKCRLSLVHNNFDENGKMSHVDGDDLPTNSAKPWIRFSPKNFTAEPLSPQTVRFSLRRKANSEAKEYRSYLEVFCDEVEQVTAKSAKNPKQPSISIKPRLVQNVPIIVRTGKLKAQLSFSEFELIENKLFFNINRQGNRSVYGSLELINKETDEVINYRKNISVYTDTNQVRYDLTVIDVPKDQLAVRFVEDQQYGGSITHQQDVVLN